MNKFVGALLKSVCLAASPFHAKNDGPLVVAAMVRNEIDIIDVWLSHLCALFDRIIIYDHMSSDGTRERLMQAARQDPRIEVRFYDKPSHDQSDLMTGILREEARPDATGWLFFLDADEFVIAPDKSALHRTLHRYRAATTLLSSREDVMPVDTRPHTISPDDTLVGWHGSPPIFDKIVVNLTKAQSVVRITQGNHKAGSKKLIRKVPALALLHIPVRSVAQIAGKVRVGLPANDLVAGGSGMAHQWRALSKTRVSQENLSRAAFEYSEKKTRFKEPDKPVGAIRDMVVLCR